MLRRQAVEKKSEEKPQIGGKFEEWRKESGVGTLLRFVKNEFSTIPYFTDIMKCGVAYQTNKEKKVFEKRINICIKKFLYKEIEIIDPEIILCVGKTSFDVLKKAQENRSIKHSIKLVNLIHYGKQAGLPLTAKDKEEIIWALQLGKIPTNEVINKIIKLSAIQKIINDNRAKNKT